jgi:hypothetical protein
MLCVFAKCGILFIVTLNVLNDTTLWQRYDNAMTLNETLGITTLGITTLGITTFGIRTLNMMAESRYVECIKQAPYAECPK